MERHCAPRGLIPAATSEAESFPTIPAPPESVWHRGCGDEWVSEGTEDVKLKGEGSEGSLQAAAAWVWWVEYGRATFQTLALGNRGKGMGWLHFVWEHEAAGQPRGSCTWSNKPNGWMRRSPRWAYFGEASERTQLLHRQPELLLGVVDSFLCKNPEW